MVSGARIGGDAVRLSRVCWREGIRGIRKRLAGMGIMVVGNNKIFLDRS